MAIKKDTGKKYALKVINKIDMIEKNFIENMKDEKNILSNLHN